MGQYARTSKSETIQALNLRYNNMMIKNYYLNILKLRWLVIIIFWHKSATVSIVVHSTGRVAVGRLRCAHAVEQRICVGIFTHLVR